MVESSNGSRSLNGCNGGLSRIREMMIGKSSNNTCAAAHLPNQSGGISDFNGPSKIDSPPPGNPWIFHRSYLIVQFLANGGVTPLDATRELVEQHGMIPLQQFLQRAIKIESVLHGLCLITRTRQNPSALPGFTIFAAMRSITPAGTTRWRA